VATLARLKIITDTKNPKKKQKLVAEGFLIFIAPGS